MKTITQDISKLLRPTTGASFPHQTKEHSSYQYMSVNCFRGTAQKRVELNMLDFFFCGDTKPPSVFSSNWQRRQPSPVHFWCLQTHSQPSQNLWKRATLHDQTCPCMYWFRWRVLRASVVNC